jgi:hypothetical protein
MTENQMKFSMALMVFIVLGFPSSPSAAPGTVVFNTFGRGDTFSRYKYGTDGYRGFQAFRFVAKAGGALDKITVALARDSTNQTTTVFSLYKGSSFTSLGELIESFVVPNTGEPSTGNVVSFVSTLKPPLVAGHGYWLSFSEAERSNSACSLWFFSSIGVQGKRLTNLLPAHKAWLPAFRVEVTAVAKAR